MLIVANIAVVSVCAIQRDESTLGGVDSPFGGGGFGLDHLSYYQGEQTHEDGIVKVFVLKALGSFL